MPLRALVDGRELIAPFLAADQWAALRDDAAAGRRRVVLPCCRGRGYLRTSHRGTQHFYHRTVGGCTWAFESSQHLRAKAEIALGCRAAGYDVRTECVGDGWRADVLAVHGATKVAFEVQWSEQSLAETEARQCRYRRHGIRGCWFFRHAPTGLRVARRDLPLFELVPGPSGAFDVSPRYLALRDGMPVPLTTFVEALLSKRVRFCPRVRALSEQDTRVVFCPIQCRRCGRWSHVYYADRPYRTACGNVLQGYSDINYALRPEILAAVRAHLATEAGRRVLMAAVRRIENRIERRTWLAFGCAWCGAPLGARSYRRKGGALPGPGGNLDVVRLDVTVALPEPVAADRPHWCYPLDGTFCDE